MVPSALDCYWILLSSPSKFNWPHDRIVFRAQGGREAVARDGRRIEFLGYSRSNAAVVGRRERV